MQARIIIGLAIMALCGALWTAIESGAESRALLEQEQAKSEALAKQVGEVAESYTREYTQQLKSQEEAYRVRHSHDSQSQGRRKDAEARFMQAGGEARDWAAAPVPAAVADSLCIQPGSCAGELPAAAPVPPAAGRAPEAGTGDTAEGKLQLTNDSLRAGVEDLRHDLGKCNAQLAGLSAWAKESFDGEPK